MLVLSRKLNEQILLVSDDCKIRITIVGKAPNKIKIGIDAPEQIKVLRAELEDKKQATEA